MSKGRTGGGIANIERPLASVDLAIFGIVGGKLCVLLVKRGNDRDEPYPGVWALPGGFIDIDRDHDLEACAVRKLKEKTGLTSPYLEQLGSWGDAKRDPRGWSATHAFFALIPTDGVTVTAGANAVEAAWVAIAGSGMSRRLAFDHGRILQAAVERLRGKVEYTSLPIYLLEPEFTLTDLQRVYEIVLDRPLEKSAFRARILAAGFIEPTASFRGGSNRPARLYRLKRGEGVVYFTRNFEPRREKR
jgi:ADP-ribose pyrophosphatase YjhB (NUDIX family)